VGIWGKPTVINNVETLCAVPHIVMNGGSWYAGYGNEFSKGSKIFSVSGDVDNPGIFEVELGKTTIEELLAMAGTDIDEVKAVSMGGVSGRLLPNTELTKPICYRNGYVGGGAVIVYGWDRWIADILLNISEFFEEESCGQCTPCRLGTAQMVEGLEQICDGRGNSKLLATLTELAEVMADSSKCGLGQSAPTPFLDAIKYFKDEILGWEV
jgi:NADH:ubiquinone oxidoreductase subunit F (NADH-binding)